MEMEKEKKSLAELLAERRRLLFAIENLESDDQVTAILEDVESQVTDKVDAYAYVIQALEALSERFAKNAKEWTDLSKSYQKKADRVLDRLEWNTRNTDGQRIKGTQYEAVITKNPPSLVLPSKSTFSSGAVIPEYLVKSVPEYFREQKNVWLYRTDDIKTYLKDSKSALPFASLERKERVSLKPLKE